MVGCLRFVLKYFSKEWGKKRKIREETDGMNAVKSELCRWVAGGANAGAEAELEDRCFWRVIPVEGKEGGSRRSRGKPVVVLPPPRCEGRGRRWPWWGSEDAGWSSGSASIWSSRAQPSLTGWRLPQSRRILAWVPGLCLETLSSSSIASFLQMRETKGSPPRLHHWYKSQPTWLCYISFNIVDSFIKNAQKQELPWQSRG